MGTVQVCLCLQDKFILLKDTSGTGARTVVPGVTASLDILQQLALTKRALTYKLKHMHKNPFRVMQKT